ncbi:hypothetical protein SAMN05216223_105281 [Actinacidiphila yanglinensis]|uniref:Lipoprotein n=1 Tax=Actinacidiphila yanglinensis TaxID=310779 RepID=A0A1H6ACH8_9ACTN|nr:hypothetical protein [Actinacidiphila yanglinensis]SEG45745.1 hypothetical protein SAMN05216223_105281 [Actinacidiphila yanglinensis]
MIRRTALASVALGSAALLLTACGSSHSAASTPANSAKASSAAGSSSGAADPSSTPQPSGNLAGSGNAPAPNGTAPTAPPAAAPATPPAAPAASTKTAKPIRTQTLVDGSKAEIYRLGDEHYRAKVVDDKGELFVTLETHGHDAGLDANDMFIELSLDGTIHSWMGGGHQGPGTFKLAGGWTAKVTKIGELRYRAQILGNEGEVDATVETDQQDVGLDANGISIVLSNGGIISAHA